jgi:hypothetical protein
LDNTEAALDASEDAEEGLHARIKELQRTWTLMRRSTELAASGWGPG